MNITYIPTKDVKAVMAAAFPEYRKRKVGVQAAETVTLHDLNWCGGTRSEYRAVTLDDCKLVGNTDRFAAMHPINNRAEGATVPIPQGVVLVRGGFFCGKESTATIYVHPANLPKLLVAPDDQTNEDQRYVLREA